MRPTDGTGAGRIAERRAPAKVNLTLHVTGRGGDGYHQLDSLVVFAVLSDVVRLRPAQRMALRVRGSMAEGVPADARNLCWRAGEAFGETVEIELVKNLPAAAGIGGGSSDAVAVIAAMEELFDRPFAGDLVALGADVPVCRIGHAARMRGIGEIVEPLAPMALHAVLVNPRVAVSTPEVFGALEQRNNPAMTPMPAPGAGWLNWLASQRNDLQAPALRLQPVIGEVLSALEDAGAALARMSGSGATCFALFASRAEAKTAAQRLASAHPDWWVVETDLA